MIISLDTETTGLDLHHSSKPYLVTTCNDRWINTTWQWRVNPLNRQPIIPEEERQEVRNYIDSAEQIILHNAKFDIHAIRTIIPELEWNWSKTHDTLTAAHVLDSIGKKDLTNLVLTYLPEKDILRYEKALHEVTEKARRDVRKRFPKWRIAAKNMEELPSQKKELWKADGWLPRAVAYECSYDLSHEYWTVLLDYANVDSASTIAIWEVMKCILTERSLWPMYEFKMKAVKLAYEMECRGVTMNRSSTLMIRDKYQKESNALGKKCVEIARSCKYQLELPAKGVNDSIKDFLWNTLKLPVQYKKKTGSPTLDKDAMSFYHQTLSPGSAAYEYVKTHQRKSGFDSSLTYLNDYIKFWIPLGIYNENGEQLWCLLYPNYNPNGSGTLRWTSSNPNAQNIKKDPDDEGWSLRSCFGPLDGQEWWSLDFKNVELRIPFYESGEPDMIALFEQESEPPFYGSNHMLVFSVLWPDLWEKAVREYGIEGAFDFVKSSDGYKSTYYQWTKNGNFAIQYNAGNITADQAYHQQGARAKIKARFSKLEALNQKQINHANKYGYVLTLPDRDIDPQNGYPLECTRVSGAKILPTVPLSYHVQGTAMWVTMKAMIKCDEILSEWRKEGFNAYMTLQVHDELVFCLPKREHPGKNPRKSNLGRMRVIQRAMASCGDDLIPQIPTPCGLSYHEHNWGEEVKF